MLNVIILKYAPKFFDIPSFKKQSFAPIPLSADWT